jgi:FAD/FMN-containing dehydrogenase
MMTVVVNRKDPRFDTLKRGHNARFPSSDAEAPDRILLCSSPEEVAQALGKVVAAGLRPTVRSGGHCYEDFVSNNPHGALIDLSLYDTIGRDGEDGPYSVASGAVLGDVYLELYKRYDVTLPAGSCFMVGAGGHISGGGYGFLSRLHGLTSDWITGLDILTVDGKGNVIERRVDKDHDPDLLRACRGAGGGNFGIITSFRFDKLPPAPREVAQANLIFDWATMTEDRFTKVLACYGDYWEGRGKDRDTWGLFTLMDVTPKKRGHFGIYIQYCQPDGTAKDLSVLQEFLDRFEPFQPMLLQAHGSLISRRGPSIAGRKIQKGEERLNHIREIAVRPALDATIGGGGSGSPTRGKYKSSYMKRSFIPAEASIIYRFYTSDQVAAQSSVLSVDSYGGAINRPELAHQTAIAQRCSIMKLQWQCYWPDESGDQIHLEQLDKFYTDLYTGSHVDPHHQGTPWGERYEGCYMNYPDSDMLRYSYWPELYYGRDGLYPFLQQVKKKYDPNNVFHSSMSVQG